MLSSCDTIYQNETKHIVMHYIRIHLSHYPLLPRGTNSYGPVANKSREVVTVPGLALESRSSSLRLTRWNDLAT